MTLFSNTIPRKIRKQLTARRPNHRKFAVERLEDRRMLTTGLTFDSVILAAADEAADSDSWVSPSATAVDQSGNRYQAGYLRGIVDFDPDNTHPANSDRVTSRGGDDAYLAKYGPSGGFVWVRSMGGTADDESVRDIELDSAGNIYITGSFSGTAEFGSQTFQSEGDTDGFLAKLDPTGNFQWVKVFGGIESEGIERLAVSPQDDITVSRYWSPDSGNPDPQTKGLELIQFDSTGARLWSHSWQFDNLDYVARLSKRELRTTANGDLIVTGHYIGNMDLDPGAG